MLTLNEVACRRDGTLLFDAASLVVHDGQKVGLTGANGSGKSSLFAMIRGALEPDRGEVLLPRGVEITHVAQETPGSARSAIDHVLDGDARLRAIEAAIEACGENDGVRHAELLGELDEAGGWTAPARAGALLNGLGFAESVHEAPVSSFSGGWRMRLNLAQALISPNALLLLDEPTNHLDLDAVLWLEEWLEEARRHAAADLARSGVPRRRHHPHDAHRARRRHPLRRELQRLPAAAGGASRHAAGRAREARGASARAAVLRRSLPRQGDQGAAGAEPAQDARAHGGERGGAPGLAVPLLLRPSRRHAEPAREPRARDGGLRRGACAARHRFRRAVRGPHRAARGERRRQVDPGQDARRRARARERHTGAGQKALDRLLRPAPGRSAARGALAARGAAGERPLALGRAGAQLPRRLRFRGRARAAEGGHALGRRARAPRARPDRPRASEPPACSTSRPTTSTSTCVRRWRTRCSRSRARCS